MENWVSHTETAFLDGGLCSEPSVFGDGNWDDFTRAVFERRLHPLSTEVKADQGHRAGMIADLTPAEA